MKSKTNHTVFNNYDSPFLHSHSQRAEHRRLGDGLHITQDQDLIGGACVPLDAVGAVAWIDGCDIVMPREKGQKCVGKAILDQKKRGEILSTLDLQNAAVATEKYGILISCLKAFGVIKPRERCGFSVPFYRKCGVAHIAVERDTVGHDEGQPRCRIRGAEKAFADRYPCEGVLAVRREAHHSA